MPRTAHRPARLRPPLFSIGSAKPGRIAVRAVVIVLSLFAWCVLTSVALPGLAPDAVTRQVAGSHVRPISLAVIGVQPVIDVMLLLFLVKYFWPRGRTLIGEFGSVRHQLCVAVGVLILAAPRARGVVATLQTTGQLGHGATDPYVVAVGVLIGTAWTLGLGWLVSKYGFETMVERGWLFLYAVDTLNRAIFRFEWTWHRNHGSGIQDAWPFLVEALLVVGVIALYLLLIHTSRRIPLWFSRGGAGRSGGPRTFRVPIFWPSPLFAAVMPAALTNGINDAVLSFHGPGLVDPAYSGLLFVVGIASVAFLQSINFDADALAFHIKQQSARVRGIRSLAGTTVYLVDLRRRLTAIAAPWFALLLAAPRLVELLLPAQARAGLYGVQIVLVGAILAGLHQGLGEIRRD